MCIRDRFYTNMITSVANQTKQAQDNVTSQTAVVQNVTERRDQVSGVSTDEEMANVVRFQNAYAASARIITTYQTILDTLVKLGED